MAALHSFSWFSNGPYLLFAMQPCWCGVRSCTMSLINLFVAARAARADWGQRQRAYDERMALDDRSLADIGIHRSQIAALVDGVRPAVALNSEPDAVVAGAFACGEARLATGHRWHPPV